MARNAVYARIAEQIRAIIGPYGHDVAIPSVRSLARRYGVACNTIRRALNLLVEQGQIMSKGSGRRLVRRRPPAQQVFCKPYPAIALLSAVGLRLTGTSYTEVLLSEFLSTAARRVPVVVSQLGPDNPIEPIEGGIAIGASSTRCSAVVFLSGAPDPLQAELVARGAIVLLLDAASAVPGVDSVSVDCEQEGEQAVEYLAGLGHRHIAYIADRYFQAPPHWVNGIDPDSERFSHAMLRAKAQRGLPGSPAYHVYCDHEIVPTPTSATRAVSRIFRLDPLPTAIVCYSKTLIRDVATILQQRKLRCPEDMSVMGRGAIGPSAHECTLLASDPARLGNTAAEHLLNRLTRRGAGPAQLTVASVLMEGPTTGPVRTGLRASS